MPKPFKERVVGDGPESGSSFFEAFEHEEVIPLPAGLRRGRGWKDEYIIFFFFRLHSANEIALPGFDNSKESEHPLHVIANLARL